MARPYIPIEADKKMRALEMLGQGVPVEQIASSLGVTLYKIRKEVKRDPHFGVRWKELVALKNHNKSSTTEQEKEEFLRLYRTNGGKAIEAAEGVGKELRVFRRIAQVDPEFAEAWEDAELQLAAYAEGVAMEFGVNGFPQEVYDKGGNMIGYKHLPMEKTLHKMMDRLDPKRHAPQRIRSGGTAPVSVTINLGKDRPSKTITIGAESEGEVQALRLAQDVDMSDDGDVDGDSG